MATKKRHLSPNMSELLLLFSQQLYLWGLQPCKCLGAMYYKFVVETGNPLYMKHLVKFLSAAAHGPGGIFCTRLES